jgi:hypothetical protein
MQKIAEFCTTLPTESLIGLIRMHRSLGYITKGIPDLFAARPKEFLFVEVKSEGDALRAEQYVFFEALAREAPSGFLVLRVLGLTEGGRDLLRNPNDPQDMGGTIVEPENR